MEERYLKGHSAAPYRAECAAEEDPVDPPPAAEGGTMQVPVDVELAGPVQFTETTVELLAGMSTSASTAQIGTPTMGVYVSFDTATRDTLGEEALHGSYAISPRSADDSARRSGGRP